MQTFDYVTAWHGAAWPLYQQLPETIRTLLETTAIRTAELHQLPDYSMPWPDDNNADPSSLYHAFQAIPSEDLSLAASVVYAVGHWRPSSAPKDATIPGAKYGASWKFSHYADQILRERFGLPPRGSNGQESGVGFAVHEGQIRVTYASRHAWSWAVVAPATDAGVQYARAQAAKVRAALAGIPINHVHKRDAAAWTAIEAIRTTPRTPEVWPEPWPRLETAQYMVSEDEFKRREQQRMPPADFEKMIAALKAKHAAQVQELETELAGTLWLLEHREPIDNVIYYGHTGVFCWGWRRPLDPADVSRVLDFISEFPYPYEIKQASGPKLEGGKG